MLKLLTVRMFDNLDDFCRPTSPNLAIYSFNKVQSTANELPTPALVSDAVVPEILATEWRDWFDSVSDEAPCGMGIHCQEKRYEEMVCVPERLE